MSRLTWGEIGKRFYDTGIDRGVLYVANKPGVPWDGITAVEEKSEGGEARPYYLDGVKYLNLAAREEFAATLSAFFSPVEFDACDGTLELSRGLFATQQKRRSFGLTYRTMVGNDTEGEAHGYRIHLVYNALAAPSTRSHNTTSKDANLDPLSWELTTKPNLVDRASPTSHFYVDTRFAPPELIEALEDILYGDDSGDPRMPTTTQLLTLFAYDDGLVVNKYLGGRYTADGEAVTLGTLGNFEISHDRVFDNGDGSFKIITYDGLDVTELPPDEYSAEGSSVIDYGDGTFKINHKYVIDNGDGTYTFL